MVSSQFYWLNEAQLVSQMLLELFGVVIRSFVLNWKSSRVLNSYTYIHTDIHTNTLSTLEISAGNTRAIS